MCMYNDVCISIRVCLLWLLSCAIWFALLFYFDPGKRVSLDVLRSACLFVCLSVYVCLSARISQKPYAQISPNLPYLLPVARSCFTAMQCAMYFLFLNDDANEPESKTTRMFCRIHQVAPPGQNCCLQLHLVFRLLQSMLSEMVNMCLLQLYSLLLSDTIKRNKE